jgi:hypothetical protein
MSTIKTPKGTELPLINLKGKEYLQVAHRIVWFREVNPLWSIETSLVESEDTYAIARAVIRTDEGKLIATATKREDKSGFADFMEKAETGAVGRALALCGFGTANAVELDEGERIVDSPQPNLNKINKDHNDTMKAAKELVNDMAKVRLVVNSDYIISFGKFKGKTLEQCKLGELEGYCRWLKDDAAKKNKPINGPVADFINRVNKLSDKATGNIPY